MRRNALSGLHLTAVVGLIRRASVDQALVVECGVNALSGPGFAIPPDFHLGTEGPLVAVATTEAPPLKSAGTALP